MIVVKSVANPGVSGNRTRAGFFYSPGVTEPAAIGPHDASPHAGQVVRRVLLRRNIVTDAETARLGVSVRLLSPGTRDCVEPGQECPLRAG